MLKCGFMILNQNNKPPNENKTTIMYLLNWTLLTFSIGPWMCINKQMYHYFIISFNNFINKNNFKKYRKDDNLPFVLGISSRLADQSDKYKYTTAPIDNTCSHDLHYP